MTYIEDEKDMEEGTYKHAKQCDAATREGTGLDERNLEELAARTL